MIDTQAVKNKILILAMRGQLTEQIPEDESAEELYSEIIREKAKLAKEGKIKKEKSLGDIADEDTPFNIPKNWKWVYFGEIFSHNTGKALNASDNEGNLLEYITTSNMYWDHFELDNLKKMYFKDDEIEKCTIKKGDLLICEGGDIGRSAIWKFPYEMRIQNHIHKLRPYLSSLSPVFYYYVMMLYKALNLINGQGIGLQGFSSKRVHTLVVPLPPASEQARIVERIETIFEILDKIDVLQDQYASNQEALKSKLIDAAIQGKLTEQLPEDGFAEELYQQIQGEKKKLEKEGKIKKEKKAPKINEDELPFEIPLTWKWVRLYEIGLLQTGTTPSKSNPNYFGDYIPFVSPGEIQDNVITRYDKQGLSESGAAVARVVEKDSVLQVCIGGSIGKTAINDRAITFNQQINSVTPYIMNHEYIFYCLTSNYFISRIIMASAGAATPIINKTNWGNLVIPLAPLAEQDRIVEKLNGLFVNLSE